MYQVLKVLNLDYIGRSVYTYLCDILLSGSRLVNRNTAAFICVRGIWVLYVTCAKQCQIPSEQLVKISSVVVSATNNLYITPMLSNLLTINVVSPVII